MEETLDRRATLAGGICGIVGAACYVLAAAVEGLPVALTFLFTMLWTILSIVYMYTLYRVIATERNGVCNQLGLVFAIAGFAMVASMLAIQLAVRADWHDMKPTLSAELLASVKPAYLLVRMVDIGLDVAWDLFIGTALVLSGVAMWFHSRLGRIWGGLSVFFGLALVGLNVYTFPTPPAEDGLFDIGPFIALYFVALSIRLVILSRSANPTAGPTAAVARQRITA